MAVTVIKTTKKETTCKACESTLSYEYDDVEVQTSVSYDNSKDTMFYVVCPVCKNKTPVERYNRS